MTILSIHIHKRRGRIMSADDQLSARWDQTKTKVSVSIIARYESHRLMFMASPKKMSCSPFGARMNHIKHFCQM